MPPARPSPQRKLASGAALIAALGAASPALAHEAEGAHGMLTGALHALEHLGPLGLGVAGLLIVAGLLVRKARQDRGDRR
jgi:hypothetical protein